MTTLKQHNRMRGLFMIERQKHNPDGSPIPGTKEVVAPWQDNLLLDSGLVNLGYSSWMVRCRLGAGSSAPTVSDTDLEDRLGTVTGNVSAGPTGADYASVVGTYVFPPGNSTGIVSELGVGPSSGSLTTRALVKDENGNPTTIVKGPIDSLTVTYQMRLYPDMEGTAAVVVNPHTSESYNTLTLPSGGPAGSSAAQRLFHWHSVGPVSSSDVARRGQLVNRAPVAWDQTIPSGSTASSASALVVNDQDHYAQWTMTWNEGAGNVPGGANLLVPNGNSNALYQQTVFDPPIVKDNTMTLSITLRKSWGRYEP